MMNTEGNTREDASTIPFFPPGFSFTYCLVIKNEEMAKNISRI